MKPETTKQSGQTAVAHVPGPWKYHLGRGANPRFHIQAEGGYQIASTTELNKHPQALAENEAREANARLIAMAPELLTLNQALVKALERALSDELGDNWKGEARAALAKSTEAKV